VREADFNAQRNELACRKCGATGLTVERNPNNNGVRPRCPACGSRSPLPGVQWLRQDKAHQRRPRRLSGDPSTGEVWEANGNHCAYCGKSRVLCERLGIGLTIQHIQPVVFGGTEKSVLVPFCSRCQQGSTAVLAETREIERALLGRRRHRDTELSPVPSVRSKSPSGTASDPAGVDQTRGRVSS
jgi:5-methylcytosine-specific restriction endonuclease McrA